MIFAKIFDVGDKQVLVTVNSDNDDGDYLQIRSDFDEGTISMKMGFDDAEETTAVEYYPAQSELIDDHNIYWLWIFPNDVLPKTFPK